MRRSPGASLAWLLSGCLAAGLAGCGKRVSFTSDAEGGVEASAEGGQAEGGKPGRAGGGGSGAGGGFRFPAGPGGKQLADLLTPSEKISPPSDRSTPGPLRFSPPPTLEKMEPPLPPNMADVPRLPLEPLSPPLRPRLLPEEPPLYRVRLEAAGPQRLGLPAGILVRVPSPDVDRPVPLPVLAQESPDRAPLDDPTGEASVALALEALIPQRVNPAPFLRLTLPDPFEHSEVVRLRTPPPEAPTPPGEPPKLLPAR
jgi:hypothetical protein